MKRGTWAFACLGLAVAGPAGAQTAPEVRDVYSTNRPASRLGPAVTPQRVLDEAGARLGAARFVRYEVSMLGPGEISGTVLLGKDDAAFERFRVTVRGRTPYREDVLGVVGSDGRSFFVVDMRGKTVLEGERWEELGAIGSLARDLLLPELELPATDSDVEDRHLFKFPSAERVGEELCYVVHFSDETKGEHLYVSLSIDDGLPRRVERVRTGPDGHPTTVTLDVSDLTLDPSPPAGAFEPFTPAGFERVER